MPEIKEIKEDEKNDSEDSDESLGNLEFVEADLTKQSAGDFDVSNLILHENIPQEQTQQFEETQERGQQLEDSLGLSIGANTRGRQQTQTAQDEQNPYEAVEQDLYDQEKRRQRRQQQVNRIIQTRDIENPERAFQPQPAVEERETAEMVRHAALGSPQAQETEVYETTGRDEREKMPWESNRDERLNVKKYKGNR